MLSGGIDLTEDCPQHKVDEFRSIDDSRIVTLRTKLEGAAEQETENCSSNIQEIKSTKFYSKFKSHSEVREDLLLFFTMWARNGDSGISDAGEFADVTENIVSDFESDPNNDASLADYVDGKFSNTDEKTVKHCLVHVAMINGDGNNG